MQTAVLKPGIKQQTYYKIKTACVFCKALLEVPNTQISVWNKFTVEDGYKTLCAACDRHTTVPPGMLREADKTYLLKLTKSVAATYKSKAFWNLKGIRAAEADAEWNFEDQFGHLNPAEKRWVESIVDAGEKVPEFTDPAEPSLELQ